MTLAVSILGRRSIWLLADRRPTYKGAPPKDDAIKIVGVDAKDWNALLAYSGLGKTAAGTEPSDWVVSVPRGVQGHLEDLQEGLRRRCALATRVYATRR